VDVLNKFSFLYLSKEADEDEKSFASPRAKSPRRKFSYSTSIAPDELTLDPSSRRRSSFWNIDDDEPLTTTRQSRRRQYSWGPAGEAGFRDSIRSASSRSPVSHHECN